MTTRLLTLMVFLITASTTAAQFPDTGLGGLFYIGAGQAMDEDSATQTPVSLGALMPTGAGWMIGFDIAREGTTIDTTYNRTEEDPSTSYNLIVGTELFNSDRVSVSAGVLAGFLNDETNCNRQSFIGERCYAGEDPEESFTGNLGGLLYASWGPQAVGLRITDESAQIFAGFGF